MIESSKTSAQNCNNCNGNKFQLSHKDCSCNSNGKNQSTFLPTRSCQTKMFDSNGFDVKNKVVVDNVSTISQINYTKCHVGSSNNVHPIITCTPQHLTKNSSTTTHNINNHLDCAGNDSEKNYSYNSCKEDVNKQRMHDLDTISGQTPQNNPTIYHSNLTKDIVKESPPHSNVFQVNVMVNYTF